MSLGEALMRKLSALPWRQFGHILLVAFLAAIAGAIFYKPAKTNGMYLSEIIESHALVRNKRGQGGFKVLVQHLYPGVSRSEGVVHGTLLPIDPYGT